MDDDGALSGNRSSGVFEADTGGHIANPLRMRSLFGNRMLGLRMRGLRVACMSSEILCWIKPLGLA